MTMHASAVEMPAELDLGAIQTKGIDWGGQLVRHIVLPAGTDFAPLFEGLPEDRCACPHWGYVISGTITIRYADGTEESNSAGEMFYWPGGHTACTEGGVTFVEFSPTNELRPVLDHVMVKLGL
jgi:hypothetical protein